MGLTEEYVTTREAARILGNHPLAVSHIRVRGQLPGEKIANRWLIPRAAVEEMARTYIPKRGRPRVKHKYTRRGQA